MIAVTTNTAGSASSAPPALGASMYVARRFASALIFVLRQAVPVGFSVALAVPALAQPSSARQTGDVVELRDAKSDTIVSVLPSVGNIVFEMKVKGQKVLRWPYSSIEDFKARPALSGIPFVGPWANRLDEPAFYANGKKYPFDMELGNVRGAIPIHGFLSTTSEWKIVEVKADAGSAWATSALEFYRQPAWMKQWPFAHRIEITYRVQNGALEVRTAITNMSAEPMPVAIGFHPYFQLTDSSRNEWTIAVGARTRWLLAPNKVPTGETEPIERLLPDPQAALLRAYNLDDVFSDLVRNPEGLATMSVAGKSQRLDVVVGLNFRSIVIWAPHPENTGRGSQNLGTVTQAGAGQGGRGGQTQTAPDRNFICFEPMAGVTNAINLAHRGLYKDLQSIPPGATWRESFWVKPSGF
jgi:aldose 1-epimerase